MSLSNTIKLKGLYTFGNELSTPEGSLRIADNVNIDEPNVLTKRRGFADFSSSFNILESDNVRQLMSYKDTPIAYFGKSLYFHNIKTNLFDKFSGEYFEISDDIRFKSIQVNGNFYFTTNEAIKKISALSANQFSTSVGYITNAGVPEALDGSTKIIYTSTGFLPPQSKVAYKILFGNKDVNNVLNLGASTARMVAINSSKDVYTYEKANLIFKEDEDFKAQRTSVTCPVPSEIVQNSIASGISDAYMLLSNSNNAAKYQIYFKKDTNSISPILVVGATLVEVDISSGVVSASDVAAKIETTLTTLGLYGITINRNNNSLLFSNNDEGISDGVTFSNLGTTPTSWNKSDLQVGTESRYVGKYFLIHSEDRRFCAYYGNSKNINVVPSDTQVIGYSFIPILIDNNSSKSYIANQTSIRLSVALQGMYDVNLNVSLSNPTIQLTDKVGGNIEDLEQGTMSSSNLEILVLNQGSISKAQNANVEITFTVPQDIDSNFFYRIYRTAIITVDQGLTLDDIDPGEDCNLVYEGSVNVPAGSNISVVDITNESFRNSGEFLYNNPITGDGILQNNYMPPVSRDMTVYKNYTFYANTKMQHQITSTAVSVDRLISGLSTFNITKNKETKTYTFVGKPSEYELTTPSKVDVIEHSLVNTDAKMYLYSAMDLTKYVVYFDKGNATVPTDTDAIAVKVDLSEIDDSTNISEPLYNALNLIGDFLVENLTTGIKLVNNENGESSEPTTPNNNFSDIGIGFNLTVIQNGEGEDLANGKIFLSNSPSVGLKIERTIRSLVRVLNADIDGFVNAYYLSGQNDLPGKYLIKARNNEDEVFYVTLGEADGSDFNPEIPNTINNITSITKDLNYVNIEISNHGFTNGEEVYFYLPDSIPNISGKYEVNIIDIDNVSIFSPTFSGGTSNSSFYFFPFEKSDNLSSPNRVYFSKYSQPEAVPLVNYFDVGSKDSPIERILALRDYMFVLKTDGVYIVSGENGLWNVRMLDTEIILCPDSAVVLNNQIYMVTNSGVVTLNETTPVIISRMIEDKFQEYYNYRDLVRKLGFGVAYRDDRAYSFWLPSQQNDKVCTQAFRYNYLEQQWTRWSTGAEASCGLVIGTSKTDLYIGAGFRPIVMKERKELEAYKMRIDYCDRDFLVTLGLDAVNNGWFRLSSLEDVETNDAIVQYQLLNAQFFNRYLRKLDLDNNILYEDFVKNFRCNTGDDLASKFNQMNNKLVEVDTKGNIGLYFSVNTDWKELQDNFNLLMEDLNNPNSMSAFQDYELSTGITEYEYVIEDVNYYTNEVLLINGNSEFIQGDMYVYKHIESVIEVNPIHFGNPSSLKKIRQGYVLVDQNNFYKMKLEYASDVSPNFEGKEYLGRNPGYWNFGEYGWKNHNYFGGGGSDSPKRTNLPVNKQRCRYISVKITHSISRDKFRLVGIGHDIKETSTRAYR